MLVKFALPCGSAQTKLRTTSPSDPVRLRGVSRTQVAIFPGAMSTGAHFSGRLCPQRDADVKFSRHGRENDDLARAIEALEMTLAHGPRSSAVFQELEGLKLASGDIEGAITSYSRCITFAPQNAALRNDLARGPANCGLSCVRAPAAKGVQQFSARRE